MAVSKQNESDLKQKLLSVITESDKPLDVQRVARLLGIPWWPAYKLVTEVMIEELQKRPTVLRELPFVVWKSAKNMIIVPRKLLAER